jgi:ElaB/YqjD/DUF883 family membrane-anchored ribosome-binding protein
MAERIRRISESTDLESFSSYLNERQPGRIGLERSSLERSSLERSSLERSSRERSSLEQRAAELGAAAGKIALIVHQTRERVSKLAHSRPIQDRISGIAESTRARAERLRHLAADRAQEFTRAARDRTTELGRQAREKGEEIARQIKAGYLHARRRAGQTVHDYPVHTAAAAGVVGFLLGAGLRIRRAKRAS